MPEGEVLGLGLVSVGLSLCREMRKADYLNILNDKVRPSKLNH